MTKEVRMGSHGLRLRVTKGVKREVKLKLIASLHLVLIIVTEVKRKDSKTAILQKKNNIKIMKKNSSLKLISDALGKKISHTSMMMMIV